MLDVAIAYDRYRFLGNEFLTWLWYTLENRSARLAQIDADLSVLEIGNRMVLENSRSEGLETITIKGDDAGLEEGLLALKKGALVTEMNLLYRSGDNTWQFNLKGESLNISSFKTPETAGNETKEDIEGAVLEKIFLYEKVVRFVESAFRYFVRLRISENWDNKIINQMKLWINKTS
jgi:translation initiation factor 2 beta subunit (eIF-2beta)/eIF-5